VFFGDFCVIRWRRVIIVGAQMQQNLLPPILLSIVSMLILLNVRYAIC
jgi:hypothetical protein